MKSYHMVAASVALIASAANATPCPKSFGDSTLRGSYIMTINPDNRSNLNDNWPAPQLPAIHE
jgi:hypothetical protein